MTSKKQEANRSGTTTAAIVQPVTSATRDMLTPSEIDKLRKLKKEQMRQAREILSRG